MKQHRRRDGGDRRAAKRPDVSPFSPPFLGFCSRNAPSLIAARRINIYGALRRDGELEADPSTAPKSSMFFLAVASTMNSSLSLSLFFSVHSRPSWATSLCLSFLFRSLLPPYESWPRRVLARALVGGKERETEKKKRSFLFVCFFLEERKKKAKSDGVRRCKEWRGDERRGRRKKVEPELRKNFSLLL